MNNQNDDDFKPKLQRAIAQIRDELMGIRTGKASPVLVENLIIDAYQGTTKLKLQELATVTTNGPTQLVIAPFDPTTIQDIEKAILTSPLHLTPRVDGKTIYIQVPALSEEQRKDFIRLVSTIVEKGREMMRLHRDDFRRRIKTAYENKTLSEDEKYNQEKELDKTAQDYISQLDEIKTRKEKEIMEG